MNKHDDSFNKNNLVGKYFYVLVSGFCWVFLKKFIIFLEKSIMFLVLKDANTSMVTI